MSATWQIITGDCRDVLATLPAQSVHTCVTSPPYFGLRSYGDDVREIGKEPTPDEFVAALVAVFRAVRRVLRDDGTVWLNLGDSYASASEMGRHDGYNPTRANGTSGHDFGERQYRRTPEGFKPKDLLGVPWMVAFALRADGWFLRSDIIWAKKNCMPESVRDRPTRSHEYIFLLTKSARYYFDSDAVREGVSGLQGDPAAYGLLSAAESAELQLGVQAVRQGESQGMAGEGWSGERSGSGQALRADGERQGEARGVPALRGTQAANGGVQGESRGSGSGATREPVRGGEGAADALFPNREGESSDGSQARQAQDGADVRRGDADSRGVGGDSRGGAGPMHVLPDRNGADDGSRHPSEQGRAAHEGERGAGVPSVQRPQEGPATGRNIRSVWHIATQPYAGAHFATFPPKLIEPCILAGAPERACGECGAPWVRVTETERRKANGQPLAGSWNREEGIEGGRRMQATGHRNDVVTEVRTLGFEPSCACVCGSCSGAGGRGGDVTAADCSACRGEGATTKPGVVLDPFAGAGTTGMVALRHGRSFVGVELSPVYAEMARRRIVDDAPLLNQPGEVAA